MYNSCMLNVSLVKYTISCSVRILLPVPTIGWIVIIVSKLCLFANLQISIQLFFDSSIEGDGRFHEIGYPASFHPS